MQTAQQPELAEIGKTYHTAIIWVSRNRYTYATTDGKFTGHCSEPNPAKFRRALRLEVYCLRKNGYFTRIKHTVIEVDPMKDIGYYAGFLSIENQEQITQAAIYRLTVTLADLAGMLADDFYYLDDEIQDPQPSLLTEFVTAKLSNRDKIALIRGLCDRIELKLMEQAK